MCAVLDILSSYHSRSIVVQSIFSDNIGQRVDLRQTFLNILPLKGLCSIIH